MGHNGVEGTHPVRSLTILSISPWTDFWSMGDGMGAPDDYQVVAGLVRRGHRVVHLVPEEGARPSQPLDGVSVATYAHPRMPVIKGSRPQHLLYLNYCILRQAMRLARRRRIDVVLGHAALVAPAVSLTGRVTRAPSVLNIYGTFIWPLLRRRGRFLSPEYWGWRVPVSKRVILNDGTQGDRVARKLGIPADEFVFWMNGIDKDAIRRVECGFDAHAARERWSIGEEYDVVLTACRLVSWKRIDRIVAAAFHVVRRRPNVLFVVAGDGPERPELERQVAERGLKRHFRFLGAIPRDEVLRLLRLADVFASVNDLSNVGNPLLEALGSGRAIIAVSVGATEDVIRDGENGTLVPPDRPLDLADAIVEILDDETLRRRLEENARHYADTHLLTWDERSENVVDLVEELWRSRRGCGSD